VYNAKKEVAWSVHFYLDTVKIIEMMQPLYVHVGDIKTCVHVYMYCPGSPFYTTCETRKREVSFGSGDNAIRHTIYLASM
jgi:hypothetical protein